MTARPERLVVVTGTGTEVGKTWVACRLARALRERGLIVAARKPVQSYAAADAPDGTDAALLAEATGETALLVC
ncbi:MAG TPA: AAA family ATPase, partial [Acidimicrobiales bacterium]